MARHDAPGGPAAILLHPSDSVATALSQLHPGQTVRVRHAAGGEALRLQVQGNVPAFHKLAILPHARGATIVKYGEAIGVATQAIPPGEHVHIHNLSSSRGEPSGRTIVRGEPSCGESR